MSGSSFGKLFQVSTFGESHGPAIGVVVDGCPAGLKITEKDIQKDLDRRRPGQSKITTPRKEADQVEILSGIFEGQTTGAPIGLLIRNTNQKSKDYSQLKDVFRPGHADYSFYKKFGIRDYRGGGRSSGRETACRVAAGAIAKRFLAEKKINITGYTLSVAGIQAEKLDFSQIEKNIVRCPDKKAAEKMIKVIEAARKEGDSVGGIVEITVNGCPAGLGDPVFEKLDARLAQAIVSIGTIKGVEFGTGFKAAEMKGSEHNDEFYWEKNKVKTKTSHSGGILGGISNGEDIVFRAVVKPASSISKTQKTANLSKKEQEIQVTGRHDPCICPRAVPVLEAMTALVLMDCYLVQKSIS